MAKKEKIEQSDGILKVTTAVLVHTLRALLKNGGLVPCVFGPAGIGKSSIAYQIAEADFNGHVIDTRLGQMQEEDLTGIPSVENKRTVYNLPFFFPDDGTGIWFFDEVNRAKKGMLQCLFQLILDRKYFNYSLPQEFRLLFAGNWSPNEAIYQVEELDPAMKSRMCMLYYTGPTYPEWKPWALRSGIRDEIIGFLGVHQALLVTESAEEKPSPNPRTWEKASGVLTVSADYDVRRAALSGYIGLEAAVLLLDYIEKAYEPLPDPADLKKGATIVSAWANKKANSKITAFINSVVEFVSSGGGYEKGVFLTFLKALPKDLAFSLLQGLNTSENGVHFVETALGSFEGGFDEEMLTLFEVGASCRK